MHKKHKELIAQQTLFIEQKMNVRNFNLRRFCIVIIRCFSSFHDKGIGSIIDEESPPYFVR